MSDDLYPIRLRWDGRAGIARARGVSVVLDDAPDLGAGPVHAMDYIPGLPMYSIQRQPWKGWEDMNETEKRAAYQLLLNLTKDTP